MLSWVSLFIILTFNIWVDSSIIDQRYKRATCNGSDFKCKNDKCISSDLECDGKNDCGDGSDETKACKKYQCPGYLFTCEYGACIESRRQCNGISDCYDNSDEFNCTTAPKPNTINCKSDEFQCFTNNECIQIDNACNGVADCQDASDETAQACSTQICPGYTYRCKYGACVKGDAFCNGIKECYDGSDENSPKCGIGTETHKPPPPPQSGNNCRLPPHPKWGKWQLLGGTQGRNYQPGDIVPSQAFLQYQCRDGYRTKPYSYQFCNNNAWDPVATPTCEEICKLNTIFPTTHITCTLNGEQIPCEQSISGTVLKYRCAPFHEDNEQRDKGVRTCLDGTWNNDVPRCTPVCGQEFVNIRPLIINGVKVKQGKYPWQATIYLEKEQICGGALINRKVVLSAAHCFTNLLNGALLPLENYEIAVGKYYRDRNKEDDQFSAQYSTIEEIYIPPDYGGRTRGYREDIAIVVLKTKFNFSDFVQPVCFDRTIDSYYLKPNQTGVVSGFGYTTSSGSPSGTLKEVKVPYIDFNTCKSYLPPDFQIQFYWSDDKICAGFYNKNTSVCKGDSGGALSFKHINNRYFIKGIVSVSPTLGDSPTCDPNQYSLYTNIQNYIDIIDRYYVRYLKD